MTTERTAYQWTAFVLDPIQLPREYELVDGKPFYASNSTAFRVGKLWLLNVRYVNYRISNLVNGHQMADSAYRSFNRLFMLDRSTRQPVRCLTKDLELNRPIDLGGSWVKGFEDIRVHVYSDRDVRAYGCTFDDTDTGRIREAKLNIVAGTWDFAVVPSGDNKASIAIPPVSVDPLVELQGIEKNWLPLGIDGWFLYKPTTVVGRSCGSTFHWPEHSELKTARLSAILRLNEVRWLVLVHDNDGYKRPFMTHRFVLVDIRVDARRGQTLAIGRAWTIKSWSMIEYITSMTIDDRGWLWMVATFEDRTPTWVGLPMRTVMADLGQV